MEIIPKSVTERKIHKGHSYQELPQMKQCVNKRSVNNVMLELLAGLYLLLLSLLL